jgi:hypothetical protein
MRLETKRNGDGTKRRPKEGDEVAISWQIFDARSGRLLSNSVDTLEAESSDDEEALFSFTLGADPREVILGWEVAVPSMQEGEVCVVTWSTDCFLVVSPTFLRFFIYGCIMNFAHPPSVLSPPTSK